MTTKKDKQNTTQQQTNAIKPNEARTRTTRNQAHTTSTQKKTKDTKKRTRIMTQKTQQALDNKRAIKHKNNNNTNPREI